MSNNYLHNPCYRNMFTSFSLFARQRERSEPKKEKARKRFQGSLSHFVHVRLTQFYHASLRGACDEAIHRSRNKCAMTYFSTLHQPHVIAENQRFVRARFLDCFAYARNDVKCAALSLAALNNFVCEANGTNIHLVKAMRRNLLRVFLLPSFAVESSARNVQNGFTLSFGRERFTFSFFLATKKKK